MKAIHVQEFGDPSVLRYTELPEPQAGPGQVLVRAKAIGVNPVETYIRSGNYGPSFTVPYTPGSDAGGIIDQAGPGVTSFRPGDRVYTAGTKSGAYAELILCDEAQVHALPENISFAQGAAIGVPYATAWYALMARARGQQGETVLVHGATGGVGIAAVQIALAHGMQVIGTGGSERGLQLVREQGTPYVFDHTAADYREEILGVNCGRGPDIILEMLANVNLGHDLKMVARRGRIAIIGSRGEITINPRDMMRKESHVLGVLSPSADELKAAHDYIGEGLRSGALKPVIGLELPLSEAAAAHQCILEPGSCGKIVLVP